FDAGSTGVCNPAFLGNIGKGVTFAQTGSGLTPAKTHLCEPFFATNRFQHRDAITHQTFHLFGADLAAPKAKNTAEALTNPSTLPQIVARLNDRFRQANANGAEPDLPPLPMP